MANDDDEERALFAQRDKDLGELYPTAEAWERRYPPLKPPEDPQERAQYDDLQQLYPPESRTQQALKQGETSINVAARRQGALDLHDRLIMRGAAEASRDALHDNGTKTAPGTYTTYEARDRAAHTPPAHELEP
jgi:hypothetical protein